MIPMTNNVNAFVKSDLKIAVLMSLMTFSTSCMISLTAVLVLLGYKQCSIMAVTSRALFGIACRNYQFLAARVSINNRNYNSREITGGKILAKNWHKGNFLFSFSSKDLSSTSLPFDHLVDSDGRNLLFGRCGLLSP